MTEITSSTVINVSGREVIVRELTVRAARALIVSDPEFDLVGHTLLEDIRLCDLPLFTNLTADAIDEMLPSELRAVEGACKAKNPDFFAMVARVIRPRANP